MSNTNDWIAIADRLPTKDALVLVTGSPSGDPAFGQFYSAVRLQDGWLDEHEALVEEQQGPGTGKRQDNVWVEEMDSRLLCDFTPTHWKPLAPPAA